MKALVLPLLCLLAAPVLAQTEGPRDPLQAARAVRESAWQRLRFDLVPRIDVPGAGPARSTGDAGDLDFLGLTFGPSAVTGASGSGVVPLPPLSRAMDRVRRDAFTPGVEAFLPFSDVPGGIVLGLAAKPAPELVGARLTWTSSAERVELGLRLADGSTHPYAELAPAHLRERLDFVENPRHGDALVDVGPDSTVWSAPELRERELLSLLLRVDRAPLRALPAAWSSKSVILDREVRVRVDGSTGRVVVRTDLEVRLYGLATTGFLTQGVERHATHVFEDTGAGLRASTSLPADRRAEGLTGTLGELLPLARELGFLRWIRGADPQGWARLREAL